MYSNYNTLQQQHNPTFTITTQRRHGHFTKNTRPTSIPSSSIHVSTLNQTDPFANMNAYVDYQQKIESLKTSLVHSNNNTKSTVTTAMTSKKDDLARTTRALHSTKRHSQRRPSHTIEDEDEKCWSIGSVMSSASSSSSSGGGSGSGSSSGYLTPPRSSSPTTTIYDHHHHHEQSSYNTDTCYVTMEDRLKFLNFLRHRTGWHNTTSTTTDTVTDLDSMKNGGSLFYWYDG